MNHLVSVIMPTYNLAKYIGFSLDSLIAQTYTNWECIIVDDGSTDGTDEVVIKYLLTDDRIKYYYKKNEERSVARNYGISLAKGSYIQFLDADDLIHKDKFKIQLQHANKLNRILVSDYRPFDDAGNTIVYKRYNTPFIGKNALPKMILGWENKFSIPCHCFLIPKKIIDDFNIKFDVDLNNHEDWIFWCQLLYFDGADFEYQYEELAFYRFRADSTCSNHEKMYRGYVLACEKLMVLFKAKGAYWLRLLVYMKKTEITNPKIKLPLLKRILFKIIREYVYF